ncbi:MAG: hypothetical protein HFH45_01875 [Bacilli bacterium]|jgi:hypothetical protein|nr:hypothetical protein [Bacilli bacterium]
MALPAILLKAKDAIKTGAKVKQVGKQLKGNTTEPESETSKLAKKGLGIVSLILIPTIFFMIFVVVIVSLPQTIFTMFGAIGGDSNNGTAYADELTTVEAPIEQLSEGMPIPHYLQYDERWGSKAYPYSSGGSNTIAASACGPSSFAMVSSYLTGKQLTPDQVLLNGKYHISGGTLWSYFSAAAEEFNCGTVTETSNWSTVYNALKNSRPVIGSYNGASLFTSAGHFIVLRGVASDGSVLVNDPNDNQNKKFINRHFSQSEMQRGANTWFVFDAKT